MKSTENETKSNKLLFVIAITVLCLFFLFGTIKSNNAQVNSDVDFTFESHSDFVITSATVLPLIDDQSDNLFLDLAQLPDIALSTTRNNLDFVRANQFYESFNLYPIIGIVGGEIIALEEDIPIHGTVGLWNFTGIDVSTINTPSNSPIRVSTDTESGGIGRSLEFETLSNASFFRNEIMIDELFTVGGGSLMQNSYMIKLLDLEAPITDDDYFRFQFFDIGSANPFFDLRIFEFNASGAELFFLNSTSETLVSIGTVGEGAWFELEFTFQFVSENEILVLVDVGVFGVSFSEIIPFSGWNGLDMVNMSVVTTNGDNMRMRMDWIQFEPVPLYKFNDGFGWIDLDMGIDINPTINPALEVNGSGFYQMGIVANDYSAGTFVYFLNNPRFLSDITTFSLNYFFNETIFNAHLVVFFKTTKDVPFAVFNSFRVKHLTLNWTGDTVGGARNVVLTNPQLPQTFDIGEIAITTFNNATLSIFSPQQKATVTPFFQSMTYEFHDINVEILLGSIRMSAFLSQSELNGASITFFFTERAPLKFDFLPNPTLQGEFIEIDGTENNITDIVLTVTIFTDTNPSNDTGFLSRFNIIRLSEQSFTIIKMTDFLTPLLVLIIPSLAVRFRMGKGTFLPMLLVMTVVSLSFNLIPLWIGLLIIFVTITIFIERMRGKGENLFQ